MHRGFSSESDPEKHRRGQLSGSLPLPGLRSRKLADLAFAIGPDYLALRPHLRHVLASPGRVLVYRLLSFLRC